MARITITEASKQFAISRNTLYKKIKLGDITKDSNGKLDTSDLIRLFTANTSSVIKSEHTEHANEHLLSTIEQLKQQVLVQEQMIKDLRDQIEYFRVNEHWLKDQLNQRLIEHQTTQKKTDTSKRGLISRFFN